MSKTIRHLLVLSGPLAIGKSYTEQQILSGQLNHLEPLAKLYQVQSWVKLTPATYLQEWGEKRLPEFALFHYELTRLITRPGYSLTDFAKDPGLEIANRAEDVSVITLWAPGIVIAERMQRRKPLGARLREVIRPNRRYEAAGQLYQDPEAFSQLYRAWKNYWQQITSAELFFWEVSASLPIFLPKDEFVKRLGNAAGA